MKKIQPHQLQKEIRDNEVLMVDFFTSTCGPCKAMEPRLRQLDRDSVPVVQIDVGKNYDAVAQYNLTSVPTILIFADGKEVVRHVGTASLAQLRTMVNRYL